MNISITRITSLATIAFLSLSVGTAASLEDFLSGLNTQDQQRLIPDGESLDPEGYDIRDKLLRPLLDKYPPRPLAEINFQAERVFEERKEALSLLMKDKVHLLGKTPWQDVGNPVNWYQCPDGDLQWTTHLNRHYFLISIAFAYRNTGDRLYSDKVVGTITHWIKEMPLESPGLQWVNTDWSRRFARDGVPPRTREGLFKDYVDGPWTSLSAAMRIQFWLEILQIIVDSPSLENEALAAILHSAATDHRQVMEDYPRQMNQFQAISLALIRLGMYLPYMEGTRTAMETGWNRLADHAKREIYPDGSLAECSPNYGLGILKHLAETLVLAKNAEYDPPPIIRERLASGLEYMALIADPLYRSPRIAKGGQDLTAGTKEILTIVDVPVARYRMLNDLERLDEIDPCQGYAWAGHYVFRSSWSEDATWMFFEPGPRGSGHADAAQLGVQLMSRGEWLLTDPGYYSYSGSGTDAEMARHLRSSFAHNVISVDGLGQRMSGVGETKTANHEAGNYNWCVVNYHYSACGTYAYGFGDTDTPVMVTHERTVSYDRESDCFTIVDSLSPPRDCLPGKQHSLEWRWQLAPHADVTIEDTTANVSAGRASMKLSMSGPQSAILEVRRGELDPIQGWYSEKYGDLSPAPMLSYRFVTALPVEVITRLRVNPAE